MVEVCRLRTQRALQIGKFASWEPVVKVFVWVGQTSLARSGLIKVTEFPYADHCVGGCTLELRWMALLRRVLATGGYIGILSKK